MASAYRHVADISSSSLVDNVTTTLAAVVSDAFTSMPGDSSPRVTNSTSVPNSTEPPHVLPHALWLTVILGFLAGVISLVTILGNITVLLAFGLERTIRQPTNYFLASLAVSDLLIGTFSMPLYTQYLLWGTWPLGEWICDLWLSLDWTVCLTSQYTVFLITMDRFLSVKIPAKYRNWRTEKKVMVMISVTWILPAIIFFTSIIGWQYFLGKRTVKEGVCEVQFMGDTMFTFLLTIGYYWITLIVMCGLYGGIYKVALDLQRKSDAKQRKMQSTMELAGDNPNAAIRNFGAEAEGQSNNSSCGGDSQAHSTPQKNSRSKKSSRKSVKAALPCPLGAQNMNMTSFSTDKAADKDDDRSSSPAFASDEENSSSGGGGGGAGGGGGGKSPAITTKSSQQGGVVNNVLFTNTGGLVRSLHGDLFFTKPADRADHRENQSLLQPQPQYPKHDAKSCTESCSDVDGGHSHEFDNFYSSGVSNRLERQTTPLLQNEINRGCRFIDEKSFLATLSSENAALLPVIASESGLEDSDMAELHNSSPIWKRRSSLPPLASDVFDIEDNISDTFITSDYPTVSTALVTSYNRHSDHEHRKHADITNTVTSTVVDTGEEETHGNATGNATNHGVNNNNCTNAPPSETNTNEDSSRSDTHCLAAVRRRRNKDTRLHAFVKSVRSRNSRRRNRRERKSKSENRARKALRTISFILGAFVLCWTPYHVAIMVIALCANCMNDNLYSFFYWLCYLNSPINPFCYAFANAQFKRTFIRIMRFDWHRT